ncbi:hypothetical protein CEXT_19151 [Caerostris extrusa]|uniref:Adult-specific rigid cuticular protein 15.7 n=1 Tax=Caerostris extrusa TaxID=172846 RepID=A0AAV4XCA2_CAEEX|nr:hypothetical protein CEXT_19151 [Caerostris extrusa]
MTEVKLLHFSNTMIAKVAFLCAALSAVRASGLMGAPLINTGISTSARQQDVLGNNAFGYTIKDGLGATNSRSEVGDGYGNRKGSYTITDIDGRARRVDYVADGHGFRATVKTNEPGTAASSPAAALVASPYAGPVARSSTTWPLLLLQHPWLSLLHWLMEVLWAVVLLGMEPPLVWDTEQAFWVLESVKL